MKYCFATFYFILLISSGKFTTHEHSFYFWRTNLSLNKKEKIALDNAKVPFLYTRFFDIDKIDGKFQSVAVITKNANFKTKKKIVPVVFIKN